jgi:8-oxo-dGTP diphosphatase
VSEDVEVRAAGGVVLREREAGGVEIALVHRPRYDDWSLPKGKLDPGEGWEEAALREVEEETGLQCSLGDEVAESRYTDAKGRSKLVRYWLMYEDDGDFVPSDEVDELRWLAPEQALDALSYERDAAVLESALARADGSEESAG